MKHRQSYRSPYILSIVLHLGKLPKFTELGSSMCCFPVLCDTRAGEGTAFTALSLIFLQRAHPSLKIIPLNQSFSTMAAPESPDALSNPPTDQAVPQSNKSLSLVLRTRLQYLLKALQMTSTCSHFRVHMNHKDLFIHRCLGLTSGNFLDSKSGVESERLLLEQVFR